MHERRAAGCLLTGFFLLYLCTAPGTLPRHDAAQMLVTAAAVADRGFAVRADFSKYGIGQSLLDFVVLPWYKLAFHVAPEMSGTGRELALTLACLGFATLPALVAALLNVLVFFLARRLGYAARTGMLLALGCGLGTMVWIYAGTLFADLTLACLWLLALFLLLAGAGGATDGKFALAGLAAGLALLVKPLAALAVPLFAGYLFVSCRATKRLPGRPLRLFLLPVAVCVAFALWFNWFRYGDLLRTGYEGERHGFSSPLLLGLYGLILSSGKGFFFYNPAALLGLLALPRFRRAHRREAWLISGLAVALVGVTAKWYGWHGDWAWGPRLLLPLAPLVILLAAPLVEQMMAGGLSRAWRVRLALLAILTLLVQGGGLLSEAGDYIVAANTLAAQAWYHPQFWPVRDDCELLHFSPRHSPLLGHWWQIGRGLLDRELPPPWPVAAGNAAPELTRWSGWRIWCLDLAVGARAGVMPLPVKAGVTGAAGLMFCGALACGRRAWLLLPPAHQQ